MFLRTMDSIITAKTSDTQISRGFHRFPSPVIIFPRIESSSMPTPTLIQIASEGPGRTAVGHDWLLWEPANAHEGSDDAIGNVIRSIL